MSLKSVTTYIKNTVSRIQPESRRHSMAKDPKMLIVPRILGSLDRSDVLAVQRFKALASCKKN